MQHEFYVHLKTAITLNHIKKPSHLLANRRRNFSTSYRLSKIYEKKILNEIFLKKYEISF